MSNPPSGLSSWTESVFGQRLADLFSNREIVQCFSLVLSDAPALGVDTFAYLLWPPSLLHVFLTIDAVAPQNEDGTLVRVVAPEGPAWRQVVPWLDSEATAIWINHGRCLWQMSLGVLRSPSHNSSTEKHEPPPFPGTMECFGCMCMGQCLVGAINQYPCVQQDVLFLKKILIAQFKIHKMTKIIGNKQCRERQKTQMGLFEASTSIKLKYYRKHKIAVQNKII